MINIDELFDMDKYSEQDIINILETMSLEKQLEFIKILEKMYYKMSTNMVTNLFNKIIFETDNISAILKLEIIKLLSCNFIDTKYLDKIKELYDSPLLDITYKFNYLRELFNMFHQYKNDLMDILSICLTDTNIDEDYRYRYLIESEKFIKDSHLFSNMILNLFFSDYFHNRNKILLCQFVLYNQEKIDFAIFDKKIISDYLLSIIDDADMNCETRIDAADLILNIDDISDTIRERAIFIISQYGKLYNKYSFYENTENVHLIDMSCIQNSLNYLVKKFFGHRFGDGQSLFNYIKKQGKYNSLDDNDKKKIEVAFIRINNDYSKYGTFKSKLIDILQMVVAYIDKHESYKDELYQRLYEELIDMSGKCTTGYVIRLLNVLSGFDENFMIEINIEESLKTKFYHYLNQKIKEISDPDFQEKVLEEMIIPSSHPELRLNFLKFFRQEFSQIKENLFYEFKDELSPTDFDLYLRKTLYDYEGYN